MSYLMKMSAFISPRVGTTLGGAAIGGALGGLGGAALDSENRGRGALLGGLGGAAVGGGLGYAMPEKMTPVIVQSPPASVKSEAARTSKSEAARLAAQHQADYISKLRREHAEGLAKLRTREAFEKAFKNKNTEWEL